jgi:hypothetical protein
MVVRVAAGTGQAVIRVGLCRREMAVREVAGRIYFRPDGRRCDGWPSGWPHIGERWSSGRPHVGAIFVRVSACRTGGRQGGRRKDRQPSRWPQVGQMAVRKAAGRTGGHQGDLM